MNPNTLQLALFYVALLYTLLAAITAWGARRTSKGNSQYEPSASIIVVARNEENTLADCLKSLKNLNYPQEKLEFVLVNDRSSDRTEQIMVDFVQSTPNAKMITIKRDPLSLTGKASGLAKGVQNSTGELLLFTDGDCIVPPTWIRTTAQGYDNRTGLLGGFLLLDKKGEKNPLFSRLQSIDWIYITTVGSAWTNLGCPMSVFGNNLSIRREVYEKIGGFESVGNHITEDFALTRNVSRNTNCHVRILLDPQNTVHTKPARNVKEFFNQRKRWAIGARSYGILPSILMGTTFLAHLMVFLLFLSGIFQAALLGILVLLFSDLLLLYHPLKTLKRLDLLKFFFLYEIFYFGYTLFFAPVFLFARRVTWKDTTYRRKNRQTPKSKNKRQPEELKRS